MSRLAEVYDGGGTLLSAVEIAQNRRLQKPFVSKLLSTLSQAGLVKGMRGPGGGFTLAREPNEIRLCDIVRVFEQEDPSDACPFGGGTCGAGEPCAIHHKLVAVREAIDDLLTNTTLESFRAAAREDGLRPASGPATKPRESYRAGVASADTHRRENNSAAATRAAPRAS
ncbi:MAG: Rrf2 family transcriptional regulator [Phycisphaerales bacterium]|nr:Rrf2 family transcriptional regulator [Phycisphaerales bacterium]